MLSESGAIVLYLAGTEFTVADILFTTVLQIVDVGVVAPYPALVDYRRRCEASAGLAAHARRLRAAPEAGTGGGAALSRPDSSWASTRDVNRALPADVAGNGHAQKVRERFAIKAHELHCQHQLVGVGHGGEASSLCRCSCATSPARSLSAASCPRGNGARLLMCACVRPRLQVKRRIRIHRTGTWPATAARRNGCIRR